ncbi:hypothetical protein AKJ65_05625 [candidate division MSBL1 archaeon SCGC-AAA259E19]|uniref:Uncharacterized protein n=1 Tax=candidate division MSBL1 archaeon SCGC-AAA259E19 TaxID=1698264 RepID=A0A133UIN7_9EURY|nr:hypothetical protein AKJ65_05625 [candidate division MSBL1 archaeon SCGC-AAA259E19]
MGKFTAEKILDRRIVFDDGTVVEARAFRIPESKEYPDGIKYSFQHYNPETGKTLLRYDNYREHAESRHHKHLGGSKIRPVMFEGLQTHFKKFMKEVRSDDRRKRP